MARLMVLLALLASACEEETTAYAVDHSVVMDLSLSICSAGTGGSCNVSSLDWCEPSAFSQNICVCAHPSSTWYCCNVDTWSCPGSARTGDFCCPQPSGQRQCGACTCVDGQFVCNGDAGARD